MKSVLAKAAWILFLAAFAGCGSGGGGLSGNSGSIFYIDADGGSDTNDGSKSRPWQSLGRLSTATVPAGSTVYLKRGAVWNEGISVPASGITFDAYGSGARPLIDGSSEVVGWQSLGGGLYTTTVTLDAEQALGNLSENDIMLEFLPWLGDTATTFSGSASGSYSFAYPNVLYLKSSGSPAANSYRASVVLRGFYAADQSDITVRNVDVTRVSLNGIELKNCQRCTVEQVRVTRVGGAVIGPNSAAPPSYLYAGNGIDFSNSVTDSRVQSVEVHEIFDSGLALELYQAGQTARAVELSSAVVDRSGFAGVEISVLSNSGANTGSLIEGVTVDNVTIYDTGAGWSGRRYGIDGHGIRIVADAGAGSMSGIRVQRTTVTGSAGAGIHIGGETGEVSLHRVKVEQNSEQGLNVAAASATSIAVRLTSSILARNLGYGMSYNAPQGAGLHVYQTTFYGNGTINLAVFAQAGVADLQNNLFFGSTPMTHVYSAAILAGATLDRNCYNDGTDMFGYNSAVYPTVASFSAATGLEVGGRGDGPVALSDPENGIYTLQAASVCRGLGASALGVTDDYTGSAFANPPASGAYEY